MVVLSRGNAFFCKLTQNKILPNVSVFFMKIKLLSVRLLSEWWCRWRQNWWQKSKLFETLCPFGVKLVYTTISSVLWAVLTFYNRRTVKWISPLSLALKFCMDVFIRNWRKLISFPGSIYWRSWRSFRLNMSATRSGPCFTTLTQQLNGKSPVVQ